MCGCSCVTYPRAFRFWRDEPLRATPVLAGCADTESMAPKVVGHRGYPTIRDFWNHYTEFADLYDRFALSSVSAVHELDQLFGFADTRVLNIGSGSGRDSLLIAQRAREVIGIEPSPDMRNYALAKQRDLHVRNVRFVDGVAEDLGAFDDGTFDRAVSIHAAPFPWDTEAAAVREALRVVRSGGHVAIVSTTPAWRMDHERGVSDPPDVPPDFLESHLGPYGFTPQDALVTLDYGSLPEALATWGCIYGEDAIDHLLDRRTSVLTWSLRIWHRQV